MFHLRLGFGLEVANQTAPAKSAVDDDLAEKEDEFVFSSPENKSDVDWLLWKISECDQTMVPVSVAAKQSYEAASSF